MNLSKWKKCSILVLAILNFDYNGIEFTIKYHFHILRIINWYDYEIDPQPVNLIYITYYNYMY